MRSDGRIQFKKGKIITPVSNTDGYLQFKLCKDGKYKTSRVHRIVAETFIDNPENLPEVNHKDCNRKNNHANNLEWSTHSDNVKHSTKLGHYKKPFGEKNPNYKGTKLKDYYRLHPEEKIKLGRPGAQNGRAKPILMIVDKQQFYFNYIGECARYLIDNKLVSNINYTSLTTRISERIRTGKPYQRLTFFEIN